VNNCIIANESCEILYIVTQDALAVSFMYTTESPQNQHWRVLSFD